MKKKYSASIAILRIMRAAHTAMFSVIFTAAAANPGYGELLDRKISLKLAGVPFEQALNEIGAVAKVKFAYSTDQLRDETDVSIDVENGPLGILLEQLFRPRNIRFRVHEKNATITLSKIKHTNDKDPAGHHDAGGFDKEAPFEVSGTVIEEASQLPMAGVNVVVKGTTQGTTTDVHGNYTLTTENNDILVFSFIGYVSVEVPVRGRTTINVTLVEDLHSLKEVVVNAGYWEVKEQERTGNISRITSAEIEKQPVSNPLQALQGRMPGVYIQQNTGVPGGGFNIQIRGRNSLREEGNDPLYIIDGVPFTTTSLTSIGRSIIGTGNPLAAINPQDIESIEILKDADATAVYGSRGANGVILITTKRGEGGRTRLDVNFASGIGRVATRMDLLNTSQYVEMRREAFVNDARLMNALRAPDILVWDTTRYTDWQQALIGGTAHTANASMKVSGGNENTVFAFSGGYYRETTVFPGDFSFQRLSGAFTLGHTSPNGRFKFDITTNYSRSSNRLNTLDLTGIAVTLPPNAPALYDGGGRINSDWQNTSIQNPLLNLERMYKAGTANLVTSSMLSYRIAEGLRLKAALAYTGMDVDEISTNPLSAIPPQFLSSQTGSSNFGNGSITTWIIEPQLEYSKESGAGTLSALLGATLQESIQQGQTVLATGYTTDALLENVLAAPAVDVTRADHAVYRYTALFGRLNYVWKDRYILNVTGRRDGSSRFGPGKQFGNFGAVGAAWIFSNEGFVRNAAPFLSFGKLRSSYGSTGSDAIGNYQYLDSYSSTQYPYNGTSGLVVSRLNNPDYSWETNRKFESGLELGLFKDRLSLSASWYRNRSSDQLVGFPLPVLTGQSSVQFNLPATVENAGWEFQVSSVNVRWNGFQWATTFNITLPENKLVEFPDLEAFPVYDNQYTEGGSLFLRKTLQLSGVDQLTGLYTFTDIDGDGSVSTDQDGLFLEEIAQHFYGGINNSFSLRGLQVDVFFQFVKQSGGNYIRSFSTPGTLSNQPVTVVNRWQESGDVTDIQRYASFTSASYINNRFSDNAISDASFIRLKNVSLSWQLPADWFRGMIISRSRIFLQGQNLFTWTAYQGMDPESQNVSFLPPLRTVAAGIQLTF